MTDNIMAYVGVDWASATHYAYALDATGQKLGGVAPKRPDMLRLEISS
ncbi:hypothetical protein [Sinorhizobium meliloti]|nr:hypothetical protein [Sinorhizobium meliloti]